MPYSDDYIWVNGERWEWFDANPGYHCEEGDCQKPADIEAVCQEEESGGTRFFCRDHFVSWAGMKL